MTDPGLIRVLQVVDSLGMGGAETWLIELLRLWSKCGRVQVDVLATSGKRGLFDDEAEQLGARIYYLRYSRSALLGFANGFSAILRNGHYAAVHDHQDYISGWHFFFGGRVALPAIRVTHVHNPAYQILSNYGVSLMRRVTARIGYRLVAKYATHITGTSRQSITEYGFDAPAFDRIPKAALHCGFDPMRFLGNPASAKLSVAREFEWPADATLILFAGRMDQSPDIGNPQNHKNSGFAVAVGIECARCDPRVRLLFVGAPSPAVPILEKRIAAAGFSERFRFTGIRRDVERLMLASDVLLFPSRAEGLGMVAVEAQAAGLPVLASSAVPRECAVVPNLIQFKEVAEGAAQWAVELLRLSGRPRAVSEANKKVAASPFAIRNSADALLALYTSGGRG
jgi:glycosyltransferase involved in cell wall biosynthesis